MLLRLSLITRYYTLSLLLIGCTHSCYQIKPYIASLNAVILTLITKNKFRVEAVFINIKWYYDFGWELLYILFLDKVNIPTTYSL